MTTPLTPRECGMRDMLCEAIEMLASFDGHPFDPRDPDGWVSKDAHALYLRGCRVLDHPNEPLMWRLRGGA